MLTDLKKSRDPPPAATVLMSSWGACRVTPAVVASNTCSYWPAYRLTSVDVPGEKDKEHEKMKPVKVTISPVSNLDLDRTINYKTIAGSFTFFNSIPQPTHPPCQSQSQVFSPFGCMKWWRTPPHPLLGQIGRPENRRTAPWESDRHRTAWTEHLHPGDRGKKRWRR